MKDVCVDGLRSERVLQTHDSSSGCMDICMYEFAIRFKKGGDTMPITKINKWGNSQGVLIPKALCESVGFRIGDNVEMAVNPETQRIELFVPAPVKH